MESQPQNPEFRINPENLHPCFANIIRFHQECEGEIEKSVPRITVWHHEACRVITKGDLEGQIFISHPHHEACRVMINGDPETDFSIQP